MPSRPGYTTIEIKIPTKDKLVDLGKKNETYDDIINKIIGLIPKKKR